MLIRLPKKDKNNCFENYNELHWLLSNIQIYINKAENWTLLQVYYYEVLIL